MISINATLVVQVILFLILAVILNRLMFRPILKLINDRTNYIHKTKNEISNIEMETERLKQKYLSVEVKARKEAVQERAEIKSVGIGEAEELFEISRNRVASIKADTEKVVDEEVKRAKPFLDGQTAEMADVIIAKIIGRRIAS